MKFQSVALIIFILLPVFSLPNITFAEDCYQDPIFERAWSAEITTGAYVRDNACMEGTTKLTTLPVGTKINIIGETDGWYKIQTGSGLTGWVGQWLISVTNTSSTQNLTPTPTNTTTTNTNSSSLISRTKGYILLQVEDYGEAWYVNPTDSKRYYMKDGPTAYEMMRKFGLGISNADLIRVQAGDTTLINRLKGRILLQVEAHGEAFYIHPETGVAHYMKDGEVAYSLMRYYSLGISNNDLSQIPSQEFSALSY